MIEHKYIGFVCKKVNFKDNDAIFSVISENKKEVFKARGISKITSKNAASCNFFMISEFVTASKTENSNQTLKQSSIVKMYKKPYEDLLVSSSFLFMCSILDQVSEQINGYELTVKCFDWLESGVYPINVLNYFLKNLCISLGYESNLKGCASCGKSTNLISFDFETGGFICNNCFDSKLHETIPVDVLKDIHMVLKHDELYEINEMRSQRLFKMYCKFLKDVVGLYFENLEFLLHCL